MELTDRELPLPHLPIRMMHQNRVLVNKLATDNGRRIRNNIFQAKIKKHLKKKKNNE
jgi:hypothetical protein